MTSLELTKRKNLRLPCYDYSLCTAFFVTVRIEERQPLLWNVGANKILAKKPQLSKYGKLIEMAIKQIPTRYKNVALDKYCIMPDHVHMIIVISKDNDGKTESCPTLSVIISSMKRWVSKQLGFSIWQKSFNDKILANQQAYKESWNYIERNPQKFNLQQHI